MKDNIENDTVATKVEVKQTDMEGLLEPQGVLCSPSPSKAEAEEMTAVDQVGICRRTSCCYSANDRLTLFSSCSCCVLFQP